MLVREPHRIFGTPLLYPPGCSPWNNANYTLKAPNDFQKKAEIWVPPEHIYRTAKSVFLHCGGKEISSKIKKSLEIHRPGTHRIPGTLHRMWMVYMPGLSVNFLKSQKRCEKVQITIRAEFRTRQERKPIGQHRIGVTSDNRTRRKGTKNRESCKCFAGYWKEKQRKGIES